jgi:hypothetical protein
VRNERQKEARRRYESSEKGKEARKRHEAAYVASGGRSATEKRRAENPISEARKAAKQKWAKNNGAYFTAQRSLRRSLERNLSELDFLVLHEAVDLAKRRKELAGYDWHVDHIIPVSKGGLTTADNLQVVPAKWNRSKSNKHTQRFWVER